MEMLNLWYLSFIVKKIISSTPILEPHVESNILTAIIIILSC